VSDNSAFSHLALSVGDLEAMSGFYVRALGFEAGPVYQSAGRRVASLMEADKAGFRGCFLRRGYFLLELLEYAEGAEAATTPRDAQQHGYAHTSFLVDDIDAAIARVEAAGGSLRTRMDHSFVATDGTALVFVLDPEGNRVELVAHPDAAESAAHAAYLGLDRVGWPAVEVVESGD
jgi:catechol 2,3-dioxygenase-like lactoylglutathione lyase family enzyme